MIRASLLAVVLASPALAEPPKPVVNTTGLAMVPIPAGTFTMGTADGPPKNRLEWMARDEDESPAHEVAVSAFRMSVHEVTNAQFETFDPKRKELRGKFGGTAADDEPVVFVTHADAVNFCAWLTKQEGKPYRLPTEAEWEYACRAGTTTAFHTGDKLLWANANLGRDETGKKRAGAVKVGSHKANAFGLFDLHGNVAEWCHDWYGPYDAGKQTDPVGRAGGYARVVRGWSWLDTGSQSVTRFARSANRSGLLPDDANKYTGFRVVMGEWPKSKPLPAAEPPLNRKDVKQTPAPKTGPDAAKPYFVNYATDKKNPVMPADAWGPIFGNHNHFSAACVCPNGDVLAVWYTCVGERDRQLAQAASRLRVGADKWDAPSLFFAVPDVNCHAPVLLRDGQRIYHFCTQSLHGWDYASNVMRYSDDSGATWSQPTVILPRQDKDALSQPCTAFVASDGALVLACDGDEHKDEKLLVSKDKGKTWAVAKGDMIKAVGKYAIHPAIVERDDKAILCFLRGPDPMPLAVSKDRGDTWEVTASPFGGIGSGNKSAALKLHSGAILLLTQDSKKQLGGGSLVALSLDGGKTWPHARKVDATVQGYMSVDQAADGTIYLIGSRMQYAACNEAWVKEGKPFPERK